MDTNQAADSYKARGATSCPGATAELTAVRVSVLWMSRRAVACFHTHEDGTAVLMAWGRRLWG